jgi:hypothetical protein
MQSGKDYRQTAVYEHKKRRPHCARFED